MLRSIMITLTAAVSLAAAGAQDAPAPQRPAPDALLRDMALAQRALEAIHPGYERYVEKAELDGAWAELAARASQGMTTEAFYAELSRVLRVIRCNHTKAEPPEAWSTARADRAVHFPFHVRVFGDAVHVTASNDGRIRPGDAIVSIDGRDAQEILDAVLPLIAVDGRTDHAARAVFGGRSDFGVSGFEHYYPFLFGDWEEAEIVLENAEGERRTVRRVRPVTRAAWRAIDVSERARDFVDAVRYENLGGGVAVLTIDTFVNYRRPVDPATIYDPLFERMAAEGVHTLILDTRANGGGSDDAQLALTARFLEEPIAFQKAKRVRTIDVSDFRPHIGTWDQRALDPPADAFEEEGDWYRVTPALDPLNLTPIAPAAPRFAGRLIALTSGENASAVTMMLAFLREHAGATLMGAPTGGSSEGPTAGVLYFLTLPETGIKVRIPWMRHWLNVAAPELGLGVTPDVIVRTDVEDVVAGRDPVLDAALALAKGASDQR